MRVEVEAGSPEEVEADVLAAPLLSGGPLAGVAATLDERLGGLLGRLAAEGELSGKLKSAPLVHVNGELKAARVAIAGVGERAIVDADSLRTAAATVVREAGEFAGSIAWVIDDALPLAPAEQARAIVDGTFLGSYDPGRWKSSPAPHALESLAIVSGDDAVREVARRAGVVADWANRARDLANAPPNELTPDGLADRAAEVGAAGSPHLSVEAPGLDEIRALGMGAFAAVAQASHNPARLIVMRYDPPEPRGDVVLGLVGKGVTFDTGGFSIKKAAYMEDM
jgi:leucyl aminopeptidase